MGLVSIVITTYRRNDLLLKAISSVLNQSYKNLQLVVIVDDPLFELDLAGIFNDNRMKVVINSENYGPQRSRNIGLANCTGKYYMNLDDDDYFHERRIEQLLKLYSLRKGQSSLSLVSSRYIKMDHNKFKKVRSPKVVSLKKLLYSNKIGNSILTEIYKVKEVGGWDENLQSAQDYDLWLRLVSTYGSALISTQFLMYVNCSLDMKRITTSEYVIEGYEENIRKHTNKMSLHHINYNQLKLEILKGNDVKLIDLLLKTPLHLIPFELKRYINMMILN